MTDGYLDIKGLLTKKALAVIDPELLVNNQKENKGGEGHIAMMKLIIREAQEEGSFAFVSKERVI